MSRPDRSDAHLPAEDEAKMEEEVREYYQGIAPKRHTKPSRSEYSAVYSDAHQFSQHDDSTTPELDKFQHLQAHPQELVLEGSQVVEEEYIETEYYADLTCIDKQHHTTGTGFIKMDKTKGADDFELAQACLCDVSGCHAHPKGNPATNEWIPSSDHDVMIPDSHKPKRSDL